MNSSQDTCAICLGSLTAREGQALFTAECSHTFHFNCIASNVQHGNHICPICRSTWTNLPSQFTPGTNIIPPPPNVSTRARRVFREPVYPVHEPALFADDEPLPSSETTSSPTVSLAASLSAHAQRGGELTLKALPEFPALSKSELSESFAVLISLRAPPLSPEASDRPNARAPIDLVAVLDISGSMNGDKIRLLKQAMGFVVDNLGPTDRLSVITFSTSARRVTPLLRMTDAGRTATVQAVNSLRVQGATNIIAGLRRAVEVLNQRRQKNPVASIILLSDGQDNQNGTGVAFLQSLQNLPPCVRANVSGQAPQIATDVVPVPVHTFGFGADHDATALHTIADGSGGTFSYIESIEVIQDAFAQCMGGLLSVVAQEVEIHVQSGASDIAIQSISSGQYRNTISNDPTQCSIVYVGDVYAEEEKQFLVYISVPQALDSTSSESDTSITKLLEAKCSYKDPLSNENIMSEVVEVQIRRPPTEALTEADGQLCLEVDRERNRVYIAEGIAQAQTMAERGELERARSLLGQRRIRLQVSASALAGDSFSGTLDNEVRQIEQMMQTKAQYEAGGRAFAYSKMSSHLYQRASTQAINQQQQLAQRPQRQTFSLGPQPQLQCLSASHASFAAAPEGSRYQTSFMRKMVQKSKELRYGNPGNKSDGSSHSNPL